MKLAIMQPYFLPYIGYFQLMNAVDTFVFYDDVSFIKQGWINRNRILMKNKDFLFTLEVIGASSFKDINAVEVGRNRLKLMKTIEQAYGKAPYFNQIKPLIISIFASLEINLNKYIIWTTEMINNYLGVKPKLLISSEIQKNNTLKGHDKIIEICKILDASTYINSIGGEELYSKNEFSNAGIELQFLQSNAIEYTQYGGKFIPRLSIIDVLMFNDLEKIRKFLDMYVLK